MQTLKQAHSRDAMYWGDRPDWLIVLDVHRDSGALTRSNFRVARQRLEAISEEHVAVERSNHWAVGWVDRLVIDPAYPALVAAAEAIQAEMENYPVLDEEDWSNEESAEANEIWRDCYDSKERIAYIREHSRDMHFRSLRDLFRCVRGKYFAGCASEMCSR